MLAQKRKKYSGITTVLKALLAAKGDFKLKLTRTTDWLGEHVITVVGGKSQVYVTDYGTGVGLYFMQPSSGSQGARERWNTTHKALMDAGCELVQWGMNVGEGCVRFDPENKKQLAAVLAALK
jgi:hypothetical protein